jgi:endo-1,4-beta-xylanase
MGVGSRSLAGVLLLAFFAVAAPAAATSLHPCLAQGADCTLREVADAAGVRVGAAAQPGLLVADPLYAPTLASEFNSITAENQMKWPSIHPAEDAYDFGPADALVDFAVANDMAIRGHTLLWADPTRIPDWVAASPDGETLHGWLDDHIRTVVGRYAGTVDSWDVVNEPLDLTSNVLRDNVFMEQLGVDYIAEAFRIAHAADPDAQLFLNEVLVSDPNEKFEAFYDLVVDLLAQGVPIHGVGLQGHVLAGLVQPTPAGLRSVVQAFADLGLVVEITEFDVAMPASGSEALEIQGRIYRRLLKACLRVTACQGITFWGFTDRYTWIDSTLGPGRVPLPLDVDYGRKPAYFGARDALVERLTLVPEPGAFVLLAAAALGVIPRARKTR